MYGCRSRENGWCKQILDGYVTTTLWSGTIEHIASKDLGLLVLRTYEDPMVHDASGFPVVSLPSKAVVPLKMHMSVAE